MNTDGDAQGNACDADDDGDGFSDVDELAAGSDPLNAASVPVFDADGDGQPNNIDTDDDGDGTPDVIDLDPLNPTVNEISLPLDGIYKGSTIKDDARVE